LMRQMRVKRLFFLIKVK